MDIDLAKKLVRDELRKTYNGPIIFTGKPTIISATCMVLHTLLPHDHHATVWADGTFEIKKIEKISQRHEYTT